MPLTVAQLEKSRTSEGNRVECNVFHLTEWEKFTAWADRQGLISTAGYKLSIIKNPKGEVFIHGPWVVFDLQRGKIRLCSAGVPTAKEAIETADAVTNGSRVDFRKFVDPKPQIEIMQF